MSAIGDYVHYKAENYLEHGNTIDQDGKPYAKGMFTKQHANITRNLSRNKAKNLDIQEIENMINAFMEDTENKKHTANLKNLEDKFDKALVEKLNTAHMAVAGGSELRAKSIGKVSAKQSQNGLYLNLREVTTKIDKLEKIMIDQIGQKETRSKLKALKQEYKALVSKSISQIKRSAIFKDNNATIVSNDTGSISKLRKELNELIQTYAQYPDISNLEGLGFENTIALTFAAEDELAEDTVNEYLEKTVLGSNSKVKMQYNKKNFSSKVAKEMIGENTLLTTTYNQREKIDVKLE